MRNFLSLVLIQTKGFLFGKGKRKKASAKQASGKISTLIILAVAFVFFGYVYSNMFSETLSLTGEISLLLPIMLALSAIVNFFFSFFGTNSVIFGTKDYEMLTSLPLKKSTVILSKLSTLIVSDLLLTVCIMIPSFIVYAGVAELTFKFALCMLLMTLFSPFMITAIAIVVGLLFSLFSSLFRRKELINGILLVAFMIGVFAFSFTMGYNSASEGSEGTGITDGIGRLYFVLPLVVKGMESYTYTALFVGINVVSFALVALGVILTFTKVNGILTARKTLKNFKLKSYSGKSRFRALLGKEYKKLFTTPVYFTNVIIGCLMALVICIALPIVFASLGDEIPFELFEYILVFAPAVFAFCYILSPSTVCSISLEGQSFWIMKTSPISMNKVFNAKIAVNALFAVPCALISSVVAVCVMRIKFALAILCVVTAVLIALFGGNLGLLANILFPRLDWTDENQAVKQGASSFITVISSMALAAGFTLIGIYAELSPVWLFVIYASVFLLLDIITYCLIMEYGEKWLSKKV